jgi:hypothetical protein
VGSAAGVSIVSTLVFPLAATRVTLHDAACCLSVCLTGLQIFLQAKPDVVILEVGIGGRIDATNIINRTTVTGMLYHWTLPGCT